ncbi:hypothetical protein CAPTEDRAFT_227328 [Capitella teleta]|uniref:Transglutaminase-like domain-containing protein n=1 Tax=Capitella teleta TaxID=283909 RepID=R7VGU8_CAPTE|nr:hypothetical protein CAPTEDRAFT_227328 [Capitella teleta]|eukprot:ELU17782.1 hypothetical protein CAPTEDRAFT_227328 [Capitella teleta]
MHEEASQTEECESCVSRLNNNYRATNSSGNSDCRSSEGSPSPKEFSANDYTLLIDTNTKEHHTDEYECTQGKNKQELIVRRGQAFSVDLQLDRKYKRKRDRMMVIMKTGDDPRISKGTLIRMKVKKKLKSGHWSAAREETEGQSVTLSIQTAAGCVVGKWSLIITTELKLDKGQESQIMSYTHPDQVYVLFNPWCREDHVFMENEEELDECLMNETGKIFSGNSKQIGAKPWNFGQFEDDILDCCLFLLDQSGLSTNVRGNADDVVRAISAIVNSSDDYGVLVGNWSGDYSDGTAPTSWVGSVSILEEYFRTKTPVNYGQCWVFSGVCTTVCRALGIPCRSVTNFSSAHDCDGSITIDIHWNKDGEPIDSWNEDSIWNFHVWNEAWMARPDLPHGYGGWQAFDATPQETSGGVYCAGPCSVAAIRLGHVHLAHDGKFIFSEVNADRVHWIAEDDGEWRKVFDKSKVGKKISTCV